MCSINEYVKQYRLPKFKIQDGRQIQDGGK